MPPPRPSPRRGGEASHRLLGKPPHHRLLLGYLIQTLRELVEGCETFKPKELVEGCDDHTNPDCMFCILTILSIILIVYELYPFVNRIHSWLYTFIRYPQKGTLDSCK